MAKFLSSSAHGKYFEIRSKLSSLRLNVKEGLTAPGTPVIMWTDHTGDNQVWYEDPLTGTIRSLQSHFCLDLDESSFLCINPYKEGKDSQQWRINKDKGVIENRLNPVRVLDVEGASKAAGARISSYEYHGKDNQKWVLEHRPPQYFWLRSEMCNKVLDVAGGKSKVGTKVILYTEHSKPSDGQLWYEDFTGNIKSKISDRCLDGSAYTVVTGEYKEGKPKSFWVFIGGKIVNRDNLNECLELKDNNTADCAELSVANYRGAPNQHFTVDYLESKK